MPCGRQYYETSGRHVLLSCCACCVSSIVPANQNLPLHVHEVDGRGHHLEREDNLRNPAPSTSSILWMCVRCMPTARGHCHSRFFADGADDRDRLARCPLLLQKLCNCAIIIAIKHFQRLHIIRKTWLKQERMRRRTGLCAAFVCTRAPTAESLRSLRCRLLGNKRAASPSSSLTSSTRRRQTSRSG